MPAVGPPPAVWDRMIGSIAADAPLRVTCRGMDGVRTIVLATILACMGCQNSVSVPTLPDAVLQLSANPASITATECPPSSCGAGSDDVEAITTMVLRETAGGTATLQGFAVTVRRNRDDATILSTTVGIGAGTRVMFMQTVNVPFTVHFPRAEAGSAMTLIATANLRDEKGQAPVFATVTVAVAAVGSDPNRSTGVKW